MKSSMKTISLVLILILGALFTLGLTASAATPGLSVVLSADGSEYAEGDTVTYECTIMNTGDVTISELTAFDTLGISSPSLGTLYPGESTSYVFNYTVTGSDVSAGSVYCSVSARGMVPGGATYSDSSNMVSVSAVSQQPEASCDVEMTVTPSSNGSYFTAGETIRYSVNIQNTGNVDLNNATVKDSLNNQTGDIGVISMGDYGNYGFTYTVTESDVENETLQCFCVFNAFLPNGSEYGAMSNTVVIPLSSDSAKTDPIANASEAKQDATAEASSAAATAATSASTATTAATTAPTSAKSQASNGSSGSSGNFWNTYLIIAIIAVVVLTGITVLVVVLVKKRKKK